jgi:hypothetical protein
LIRWYLAALAAIAVMLSVLMRGAWLVQQRTANSGWVDTALALVLPRRRGAVRLADGREWGVSHYRMKAASWMRDLSRDDSSKRLRKTEKFHPRTWSDSAFASRLTILRVARCSGT